MNVGDTLQLKIHQPNRMSSELPYNNNIKHINLFILKYMTRLIVHSQTHILK